MDVDAWNVIFLAGSQSLCLEKYRRLPKGDRRYALCTSSDVTTVTARGGWEKSGRSMKFRPFRPSANVRDVVDFPIKQSRRKIHAAWGALTRQWPFRNLLNVQGRSHFHTSDAHLPGTPKKSLAGKRFSGWLGWHSCPKCKARCRSLEREFMAPMSKHPLTKYRISIHRAEIYPKRDTNFHLKCIPDVFF